MRIMFTKAVACAALAGALFAAVPEASAMPGAGLAPSAAATDGLQEARLVCGPYHCFRRFGYGYRRFGHPYGHGYRRFY